MTSKWYPLFTQHAGHSYSYTYSILWHISSTFSASIRQMEYSQRVLNYRLSMARRVVENAFFRSTICLEPDKMVKVAMAFPVHPQLALKSAGPRHIHPAFADWENRNMADWVWKNHGMGAFQPMEHRRECNNLTVTAKMLWNILWDYFVSPVGCISWQEQHI